MKATTKATQIVLLTSIFCKKNNTVPQNTRTSFAPALFAGSSYNNGCVNKYITNLTNVVTYVSPITLVRLPDNFLMQTTQDWCVSVSCRLAYNFHYSDKISIVTVIDVKKVLRSRSLLCRRPPICLSSVVCDVRLKCHLVREPSVDIYGTFYGDRSRGTLRRGLNARGVTKQRFWTCRRVFGKRCKIRGK